MCSRQDDQPSSSIGPVPTGFREIDAALDGGLQPGSLTVIAGYTGSGVTALATHIAAQLVFPRSSKTHSPVMVDFCRHLKGIALDENIAVVATTTFTLATGVGIEPALPT
ncbi:DnaB-like helicase C-terminal domain-containing protein [Mycolicibacter heraklionensis]|uniref:DnaB-like helicase C-terminal domain-containing protein n=1 Tax=Mycolicibacter heraklionensis TaxID=512402 RepID=A0A9X7WE03_9MYCO|nr:DnaB-like helicase C-terminal domain-containing protein [Mycolicibacter heraklionensis]